MNNINSVWHCSLAEGWGSSWKQWSRVLLHGILVINLLHTKYLFMSYLHESRIPAPSQYISSLVYEELDRALMTATIGNEQSNQYTYQDNYGHIKDLWSYQLQQHTSKQTTAT